MAMKQKLIRHFCKVKSTHHSQRKSKYTKMATTLGYIFKLSWYETKRHTVPHTCMYYLHEEDTYWVFSSHEIYRVELILVEKTSNEWLVACENSIKREEEYEIQSPPEPDRVNMIELIKEHEVYWGEEVNEMEDIELEEILRQIQKDKEEEKNCDSDSD